MRVATYTRISTDEEHPIETPSVEGGYVVRILTPAPTPRIPGPFQCFLSEGLDMKRIRLLIPVVALVFALLPSSAFASEPTLYTESVFGVETSLPQPCGASGGTSVSSSFAGIARGTLNGVFQIAVCHTPLNPSAEIRGGSFTLSNRTTTVHGTFGPGGTVTVNGGTSVIGSLCIQKYDVIGGPETFAGTLLHYGHWTGHSCNVFFATISGSATLLTA